jgi:hypothetical protein
MLEMLIPASQEVPAFEPMRYASASLGPDSVMIEGIPPSGSAINIFAAIFDKMYMSTQ